jgi:hypothetical protein
MVVSVGGMLWRLGPDSPAGPLLEAILLHGPGEGCGHCLFRCATNEGPGVLNSRAADETLPDAKLTHGRETILA